MKRRGFALIIVVALLGVMAFLALELAKKSQDYRALSLRGLQKVKATLSARSAMDKAITIHSRNGPALQNIPFEQRLEPAHEDRNRNGILDSGEDIDGDLLLTSFCDIDAEATPSFALAEVPASVPPRAAAFVIGGRAVGATWTDDRQKPTVLAAIRANPNVIDVNAGVISGLGDEGSRLAFELGHPYSATSADHPFNSPLVRFLNAWGNYHKYRHMVQPGKTYDWGLNVDDDRNLPSTLAAPDPGFDPFFHSERCPGETPLGRAIVLGRPPGGYSDLSACEDILKAYIQGWRDLSGAPLPGISAPVIQRVVDEFRTLAALNPPRQSVTLMLKGPVDPSLVAYTSAIRPGSPFLKDGSLAHQRDRYNLRVYRPKMALLNINRMPPSMLSAFIHGMGDVQVWELGGNKERIGTQWGLNHSLVLKPFFTNRLSENNHVVTDWGGWEPLLSLSESLHLGSEVAAGRPYSSWGALWKKVTSTQKGYDAKNHAALPLGVVDGARLSDINAVAGFTDVFHGGERQGLMACLMNPHLNLNSLVIDEALPNPLPNRINGLGVSTADSPALAHVYGKRDFGVRRMFDKKDPHKVSGWACLDSTFLVIEALGRSLSPSGEELARTRIHTTVELFQVIDIHSQRDWETVCRHPITLASTLAPWTPTSFWISYPEVPGVTPADWDGHLALKPVLNLGSPAQWGSNLRARVPLWPYGGVAVDPTAEVGGLDIWPEGPREVPLTKHPHKIDFRNSLNPPPTESRASLLAASFGEIDKSSDLMPGGGIRMTAFGNTASMDQIHMPGVPDNTRKQAILTLRNALVNDTDDNACPDPNRVPALNGHVLPSPHEGLVSFYYKPSFIPARVSHDATTLFFMPFSIRDFDTEATCITLGAPYIAEAAFRSLFTGHLRLVWNPLPVEIHRAFKSRCDQPNNPTNPAMPGVAAYPFVHPYGTCTPTNSAPIHYFIGLSGFTGILRGNLITGGTNTNGHQAGSLMFSRNSWNPPFSDTGHWGAANPYPNEMMLLEYVVTKYASIDLTMPSPAPPMNPSWKVWDAQDAFSPLNQVCTYKYTGIAVPPLLNLFDTSDVLRPEYHTVRKIMAINHPVRSDGTGPVDAHGNHQPMIMPGRWNHIVVAWRNMEDLLDNSNTSHRGGCLAVYLNGFIGKSVTAVPNSAMIMAGLFAQSDVSLGYFSDPGIPSFYAPWAPATLHNFYDKAPYTNTFKTSLVPWPHRLGVGMDPSAWLPIPAFGSLGSVIRSYDLTYSIGNRDYLFPDLHRSIPPRFYFGCQPLDLMRPNSSNSKRQPVFTVSGIAWGSFMDIQIFSRPAPSILSPLNDGSFASQLAPVPTLAARSPYQTNQMIDIHPLHANAQWPARLVQLRWTAHMPEFHQYWDENSGTLGPDSGDLYALKASVYTLGSPVQVAALVMSQDPNQPDVTQWAPSPGPLMKSVSDLKFEMTYKSAGNQINTATPIVESLEMTLQTTPRFLDYSLQ